MQAKEGALCVLVAALTGGGLALIGAPTITVTLEQQASRGASPSPLVRIPIVAVDPDASTMAAGAPHPEPTADTGRTAAPGPLRAMPDEVRVCWSPTARRLLANSAKATLERTGARVRAMTESTRGVRNRIARGEDHIGLIAGAPSDDELAQGMHSRVLGYHVLVAIVHERNPLRDLPRHALRAAMIGETREWSRLGVSSHRPIVVASLVEDPFTDQATSLEALGDRLAPGAERHATDDAVCRYVAEHEGALGLCSLAAVGRAPAGVRILTIDAVAPTAAEYASGRYPFSIPVRVLTKDARRGAWLDDGIVDGALSPVP